MSGYLFPFGAGAIPHEFKSEAKRKEVLGGKGAALAEMTAMDIRVPPGVTISTEACNAFLKAKDSSAWFAANLEVAVNKAITKIADHAGYIPLLSVRSGARVSMPGMMDTILNVGLTDKTLPAWEKRIGKRAALDSYRRLIQMFGCVVLDVDHSVYELPLLEARDKYKAATDADLPEKALKEVVAKFLAATPKFPQTVEAQVQQAIMAVFRSWNNERAQVYRKANGIPAEWGTACTVQAMVFGNFNDNSGSGVLFSRNPDTGANEYTGEFLPNAQGEEVVAGTRTPLHVTDMVEKWPDVANELFVIADVLEKHNRDMQDIEFTVEDGVLYILQTRNAKRSATAAFKVAADLLQDGIIDAETALSRVSMAQYVALHRPSIDPSFAKAPDYVGLPACGGIVTAKPVFSSKEAVKATGPVILVTEETTPDDIAGMIASKAILTRTGGATSHAAVVARSMDKPCIVGCADLDIGALKGAETVTIDGATGRVWINAEVPIIEGGETWDAEFLLATAGMLDGSLVRGVSLMSLYDQPDYLAALKGITEPTVVEVGLPTYATDPTIMSDTVLWSVTGMVARERDMDATLDALCDGGAKGSIHEFVTFLCLDAKHGDRLTKAGYKVLGPIKTFAELISRPVGVIDHPALVKAAGSLLAYKTIMDALEKADVPVAENSVPGQTTKVELARKYFTA